MALLRFMPLAYMRKRHVHPPLLTLTLLPLLNRRRLRGHKDLRLSPSLQTHPRLFLFFFCDELFLFSLLVILPLLLILVMLCRNIFSVIALLVVAVSAAPRHHRGGKHSSSSSSSSLAP